MSKLYEIKLTLSELELIDGKVSEKAQETIDAAKKENSYGFELPLMNEVLKKAEEQGELTWTYKQITSCSHCNDKPRDYYRYSRSGKYHRKGDKNYDSPIHYSGIKFNEGFVTMKGYGDMCTDCLKKEDVIHKLIDYILDNDLKIEIQKNDYKDSKYLKDDIKICYSCENEMAESEMGKEPTMMGDGYYPSKCPKCGSQSSAFGRSHKTTNKFKHRINPSHCSEVMNIRELVKRYNETVEKDKHLRFGSSKRNENVFVVQETEFKNGHRTVIKFNKVTKEHYVGYFWKNEADSYIEALEGYTGIDDEYKW